MKLVMQKYNICSIEVSIWKSYYILGLIKYESALFSKQKKVWKCFNDETEFF